jgi:predicted transcriptional regulator of viral defense system
MSTILKPLYVRDELLRLNLKIFTPLSFRRVFNINREAAKYFLETHTRDGLFIRLKKGLYMLKTDPLAEEEIANRLYQPSYISFEYALSVFGILPESVYTITSATTKPTRQFTVQNIEYQYHSILDEAYTGYSLQDIRGNRCLLADAEKALVDYVYFEALGKKPHNERIHASSLDRDKVSAYAQIFNRDSIRQLLDTYQ